MRISTLTSGERLRRHGQPGFGSGERHRQRVENLIVIGASAGGYQVLMDIVRHFSPDMPAAIVIVLHLPLGGRSVKASLERSSRLPVVDVDTVEPLRQGHIYVPAPGRSANFSRGMIAVQRGMPPRPVSTINHMFASAAQTYRRRVIGVILSGLLRDGTEGLRAVHQAGGITVAQDPLEAEYPEMPANAMERLPVTFCLKSAEIGPALELLVRRTARFETGFEVALRTLQHRAALLVRLVEQSSRNPGTSEFLGKELASLRRAVHSIDDLVKTNDIFSR